ncbi:MAG: carbon-nitrogen hydrolase [Myxococcales bacterium]|nr:carbon-nitrogen hydrolase [Myxococcales bacterium]
MTILNAKLRVGIVQHKAGLNKLNNLERATTAILSLAEQGAQLIVLQELFATPYFCQVEDTAHFDLAESIDGPTFGHLASVAKITGVTVVVSLFEKRAAGLYHNAAVVIGPQGEQLHHYRKMHIPDDPGFYEKFYFTPGDLGFEIALTPVGKLGVLVCWDQWFPEAARLMALRGADVLIYPTAIGWCPGDSQDEKSRQRDAWLTIQRGHAIANGVPVVVVNRVGFEPDLTGQTEGIQFWGSSFVAGPQGEIIVMAPENDEFEQVVEVDLQRSEFVRRIWPFLRDRRIDAYDEILRRFRD